MHRNLKFLHIWRIFKISPHDHWPMWRNLKFLHIWHVCDLENVSRNVHFMLFCREISFVAIYVCGENMTSMRCSCSCLWWMIEARCLSFGEKRMHIYILVGSHKQDARPGVHLVLGQKTNPIILNYATHSLNVPRKQPQSFVAREHSLSSGIFKQPQ